LVRLCGIALRDAHPPLLTVGPHRDAPARKSVYYMSLEF